MKYVALLVVLGLAYLAYVRVSSIKEVERAVALPTPAPRVSGSPVPAPERSNVLKRPIDRTKAVVDQAKERHRADEF